MKGTIDFQTDMSEKDFMESILNLKHSGFKEFETAISLWAFFHSWHIDKLFYYRDLLEEKSK